MKLIKPPKVNHTKFLKIADKLTTFFSGWTANTWYLSIFFCLAFSIQKSEARDITIRDSIEKLRISGTPAAIIKQIQLTGLHFSKAPGNYINYGIAGDDYKFFVLKLNSDSAITGNYLSIDNTSLDTISIYRIYDNGKSRLLYQGGYLVPFENKRNYVWHTIPVEINPVPSFYLIALKATAKNINVQYDILSGDELQQKYQAHDRMVLFYLGFVCLILIIILSAFFLFRKKVFVIYLGYIIGVSLWIVSHYGYGFPFMYPRFPVLNEIVKPVSSLGAAFFLITLIRIVFKQNLQAHKWLGQMLTGVRYVLPALCGFMVLLLVHDLSSMMKAVLMTLWHIGLLFSICLIVFTPLYFMYSASVAKIFSAAMLVICIMAMVQLFSNSGYINNYFINEHGLTIGCLIENFIIAFGLFYGLLEENNEKKKLLLVLERDQAETLKKLICVQDNERKRIANDLHDNIGPLLAAIKINFRRLVTNKDAMLNGLVHKTELIIDDSISEIRNVAHNLMPKSLTSNGLINAMREYFEGIQQLYDKKIVFNHQVQSILQQDMQANIYRIVCELVLNAAKHSDAKELTICFTSNDESITLSIKDDGKGFNARSADLKKSFGLQSAESRIQYLKGKFALKTSPGHGTTIDMLIPLQLHQPEMHGL